MALVLGTNCGFVTIAPTVDPAGGNKVMDAITWALKDTSPAGAEKLTEVGWWCDTATQEANFEVGLYSHDAVNNCPNALLASDTVNAKGTGTGWKTVTVDWDITENTVYWIAVQLDNTTTTTNTNYTGAAQGSLGPSATALQSPWGNTDTRAEIYAFYAVWETAGETHEIVGSVSGTTTVVGITGVSRLVISTINGVCVVSGVLSEVLIPLIGTIAGTSGCTAVVLIGRVTITDVIIYKRLVVIGNNQVYYEVL